MLQSPEQQLFYFIGLEDRTQGSKTTGLCKWLRNHTFNLIVAGRSMVGNWGR